MESRCSDPIIKGVRTPLPTDLTCLNLSVNLFYKRIVLCVASCLQKLLTLAHQSIPFTCAPTTACSGSSEVRDLGWSLVGSCLVRTGRRGLLASEVVEVDRPVWDHRTFISVWSTAKGPLGGLGLLRSLHGRLLAQPMLQRVELSLEVVELAALILLVRLRLHHCLELFELEGLLLQLLLLLEV